MQSTAGQAFLERWRWAVSSKDSRALEALYHRDAVRISVPDQHVARGREAIFTSYARVWATVRSMTPLRTEALAELNDLVCVELPWDTASSRVYTYEIFRFHEGVVRLQISGIIAPRPLGSRPVNPEPTPGKAFYQRLWNALTDQDAATVHALHHPGAVQLLLHPPGEGQLSESCATLVEGRDAIVGRLRESWRANGPLVLKGVTDFVTADDVVCVEGVVETGQLGVRFNLYMYEAWLLDHGRVTVGISGLIAPRAAELRQQLRQVADYQLRGLQIFAAGMVINSRPWPWW